MNLARMNLNVHYTYPLTEDVASYLRSRLLPGIRLTIGPEPVPDDVHILVAGRTTREELTNSPLLHSLIVPWAGIPTETRDLLASFPNLALHNLHHNAQPVAELAMALLLAAAKYIVPFDRSLRGHDWSPRYQRPSPTVLLAGKTALVLGYGAIGRTVARLCLAFGMQVGATRRSPQTEAEDGVTLYPAEVLAELLPETDALIICLPHTPETDGLIGAQQLALLPQRAVLVNIGRGAIVDQQALYEALRDGSILAAGLDVWYNYPADVASRDATPAADYPFWELDNVVMSPHRAGTTHDTERLRMTHLADLLNAAARGETMPNRVDLGKGY
jgi:phosphoglycerate dehydrogenase-like enzyme